MNIHEMTEHDTAYPSLLKTIVRYPRMLYYRGTPPSESQPRIAIVGTRTMSVYGQRVVQMIVPPLVRAGYATVSGMAYGIDTCVHQTTLDAGGVTHAVLGGGVDEDHIYPRANRSLADAIIEHGGCVLSEFAPGISPRKEFFPMRNRIVAGMCKGVVVVEAPEKSGSLITAFIALDANREVFAVPGPITHRNTYGTHKLLRLGAHVVTSANDILEVFGEQEQAVQAGRQLELFQKNLSDEERRILSCFSEENPVHIDGIAQGTRLDIRTINSTLGLMELEGMIKHVGGMNYIRITP